MKKLLLIIILFVIFSTTVFSYSNSCQLAYPMMEVLSCEKGESFSQKIPMKYNNSWYIAKYVCSSDCEASIDMSCGGLGSNIYGKVFINGVETSNLYTNENAGFFAYGEVLSRSGIRFSEGDELTVSISCGGHLDKVSLTIMDYNKYMYATNHEWPHHQLTDTKNCIPQNRVKELIDKQVATGNLPQVYSTGGEDALGNVLIEPQNFVDLSLYGLNNEMKVGNTISYFYRWTVVPDINLVYDKQGTEVYCGGSTYDRKIYSYSTIKTKGGNCYNVPSSAVKKVECCSDSDCGYNNKVCGPDFTCTDQKPCNSDFQCGSIEPTCSNKILTSWGCDLLVPDFTLPNGQKYGGWCKKNEKPVACCSNSCPVNYHCDYNEGCIKDIHYLACPPGSCCLSGGDYVPRSCSEGYQCCTSSNLVGECKSTCETPRIYFKEESGLSSVLTGFCGESSSTIGTIIDFVGSFIPGSSFLTSTFDLIDNEACSRQQESPQQEDLQSGGGLSSLLLQVFTSLF